jgi:stalled ribosome alternative rescue factor ArfA
VEFKFGDRVEHSRRGKGTFLSYDDSMKEDAIVEFDDDSDAEGETLAVTSKLLKKI